MPGDTGKKRERLTDLAGRFFRVGYLAAALLLAAGMAYAHGAVVGNAQLDVAARTLRCESPLEVARLSDDSTLLNDAAVRVLCIGSDGTLRYHIDAGRQEQLTGITADKNDHLFLYRSLSGAGGAVSDRICEYDADGRFVRCLWQTDYGESEGARTIRTSPLRVEDGTLYFTCYLAYETRLWEIDLGTGALTLRGTLKSDIPFLYNDVVGYPDGAYDYAKISGEVGTGMLGGAETVLCRGTYRVNEGGFRPFYIRRAAGAVYVYDFWDARIYEVEDGRLLTPAWSDETVSEGAYEFCTLGDAVLGISGDVPWVEENGAVTRLPSVAEISPAMAAGELLLTWLKAASLPVLAISLAYAMLCLVWLILIRGRRIAWKLLLAEFLIVMGLGALLYFGISARYRNYLSQSMTSLSQRADLTAQLLRYDDVESLRGSETLDTEAYADVGRLLVENYALYESEADTAAVLLVPDGPENDCIVASNRGYEDILGSSAPLTELLRAYDGEGVDTVYSEAEEKVFAVAAVRNGAGRIVGYLCLYTTAQNIQNQFLSIWSPLTVIGYAALLCLLFVFSTAVLSRRLRRVSDGINQIADGNFSLRLPTYGRDELSTLIRCVNSLSENIENLVSDKLELTEEVRRSQHEVLSALASIVENKSGQTAAHVERVSRCVRLLASRLGYTGQQLEYVSIAAMLHDVGKLFVPAEILDKPGKLTAEEFEVVKRHTADGERLLHNAPGAIMAYARIIALEHHEKWDGSGYMGLRGEEIHMEARITAIADVFDALMSKRPYKEAFSPEETYRIIVSESGRHFDPRLVEEFARCFSELCRIVRENPDVAA